MRISFAIFNVLRGELIKESWVEEAPGSSWILPIVVIKKNLLRPIAYATRKWLLYKTLHPLRKHLVNCYCFQKSLFQFSIGVIINLQLSVIIIIVITSIMACMERFHCESNSC